MWAQMKVSKLYSNKPDVFGPVAFRDGINVAIAEIRLPQNRGKDTHNLGKTTLGRMIDFCFLAGRDVRFFLFKHDQLFKGFIFFLEIELGDGSFVTVRRSVEEASKIWFKRHPNRGADFSHLEQREWDHVDVPFERAQELLDSMLDWRAVKPWGYRKGLGYLLRTQDDYRDVFQLRKFANAHADWKPFLAHVLGFNADSVAQHYQKEEELADKEEKARTISLELGGTIDDSSKIEGMLLLKREEAEKKQALLDAFDFRSEDRSTTKQIVDQLDVEIASLNERRYSLSQSRKKIASALEEAQLLFDPDQARSLFAEAGVLFEGQIKKDFQQLVDFNRAITEERRAYLVEEASEIDAQLKVLNASLNTLGKRRSQLLGYLSATDSFARYKQLSNELIALRADIESLERQRAFLHRLQELRTQVRLLEEEKGRLQSQIEADVEAQNIDKNSLFSSIRRYFNEVVEQVIDRKALLSVSPNKLGHLEFKAEILDEAGNATSADLGHTYRKLLCIAFDMALLRAHLDDRFPRFVFHDGIFESLDDRKKENLLLVVREYADLGIESIVTLIDSDIPHGATNTIFDESEITLLLHDEGETGRLFRMQAW